MSGRIVFFASQHDGVAMKIKLSSVMVDDQAKALKFYTETLGFVKKEDIPLEPNSNPAARTYQRALFEQGIPLTAFCVEDIRSEYERLKKLGVVFVSEPTEMGTATVAVLNDTCGNLIQLYQV
jgi:predicted enzyme related to lactoylglutathione lyase